MCVSQRGNGSATQPPSSHPFTNGGGRGAINVLVAIATAISQQKICFCVNEKSMSCHLSVSSPLPSLRSPHPAIPQKETCLWINGFHLFLLLVSHSLPAETLITPSRPIREPWMILASLTQPTTLKTVDGDFIALLLSDRRVCLCFYFLK